jgi:hypothetical protein
MSKRLDVAFNGPQLEAINNLVAGMTICLAWGRGVGKSKFMRLCWWLLVAQYDGKRRGDTRGVKIAVLMPTLKQFKDVHGGGILEDLAGDWAWLGGKLDRSRWSIEFPGGSWIKPFPAEVASSKKALGMRCDVLCGDEVDDIEPSVFQTVAVPWLSATWSLNIKILCGTPRRGRKGLLYQFYSLGQSQEPKHATFFSSHATYKNVPEIVAEAVVNEARETQPEPIFKREWECDFDSAEGLVYGSVWDERFHVIGAPDCPHENPPEHFTEMVVCGDSGYTNPGCLYLVGITGKGADAICWALEEVYRTGETEDFWVAAAKKWSDYPGLGGSPMYLDPAAPSLAAKIESSTRLRRAEVNKNVEEGIRTVATLLKKHGTEEPTARLFVHPRCKNLIYEFGAYKRKADPREQDRYLEQVVKKNDHGMDALRYFAHSHFPPEAIGGREFRSMDNRP